MSPDPAAHSSQVRIGDAEREQAAQSLGAHLRAGRLDMVEYDERLQKAFTARTAADLAPLFVDLPGGSPLIAPAAPRPRRARPAWGYRPVPVRGVVLLAIIAAAIVFFAFAAFPPLFLIPLLWFTVGRRVVGGGHHGSYRRHGYRNGAARRYR